LTLYLTSKVFSSRTIFETGFDFDVDISTLKTVGFIPVIPVPLTSQKKNYCWEVHDLSYPYILYLNMYS